MSRFMVLTVGMTHSGKSTFGGQLEERLPGSLVIDQDNHASFINAHYAALIPKEGSNTIKYAVSRTILDHAVERTDLHLVICSSTRFLEPRRETLKRFRQLGIVTAIVFFDLPAETLKRRVGASTRPTDIFRKASGFKEVLDRQISQTERGLAPKPTKDEADHFFVVKGIGDVEAVIQSIVILAE